MARQVPHPSELNAGQNDAGSPEVTDDCVQPDLALAPWPFFDADEIAAVEQVLRSGKVNYWTGDQIRYFENESAAMYGARHAIALANGTLALDLALRALGIGPGDEVVVTPRSFFASTSSVILAGATPIFADVDRDSQNITADSIAQVLTPSTRALMPVHLGGWPCDMPRIMELAETRGLFVIEDCAQAHGAMVSGRSVGAYGNAAALSFCQDKIMTTGGEGGMLLTSDDELWDEAWSFKDHGKSRQSVRRDNHPPGFRWLHESIGSNYRMTEMQAAIGRVQLGKLTDWISSRRAHADVYRDVFASSSALRTPVPAPDEMHAYYKFYTFVRPRALRASWNRDRILQEIVAQGVPCGSGSCPEIYREKAIQGLGLSPNPRLPVARELGETSLMLLVHPTLTRDQVERIATTVVQVVARATR